MQVQIGNKFTRFLKLRSRSNQILEISNFVSEGFLNRIKLNRSNFSECARITFWRASWKVNHSNIAMFAQSTIFQSSQTYFFFTLLFCQLHKHFNIISNFHNPSSNHTLSTTSILRSTILPPLLHHHSATVPPFRRFSPSMFWCPAVHARHCSDVQLFGRCCSGVPPFWWAPGCRAAIQRAIVLVCRCSGGALVMRSRRPPIPPLSRRFRRRFCRIPAVFPFINFFKIN